jgi:phage recombination protein Bet
MNSVTNRSKRRRRHDARNSHRDEQLGIPDNLPQGLRQVIRESGLSYDTYVRVITASALRDLPVWTQADLERLLCTAKQHNLNPLNREIFMLDSGSDAPPLIIVGVDGWSKIMNSHPQFAGMQFQESAESSGGIPSWMECEIYRHDRVVPLKVREYFEEARSDQMVWITHPRRMLRHKCMVQCARIAFGLSGIVDYAETLKRSETVNNVQGKESALQKKTKGIEAVKKQIYLRGNFLFNLKNANVK